MKWWMIIGEGVNAFDDAEVVNTLARFKRHLQIEDSVENRNKVERYLHV